MKTWSSRSCHPPAPRRAGQVAGCFDHPTGCRTLIVVDNDDYEPRCRDLVSASPIRTTFCRRAKPRVSQAVSRSAYFSFRWADGADWVWLPTTMPPARTAKCCRRCWRARQSSAGRGVAGWCATPMTDPKRLAFSFRDAAALVCRRSGQRACVPPRTRTAAARSLRCFQRRAVPRVDVPRRIVLFPDLRLFVRGDRVEMQTALSVGAGVRNCRNSALTQHPCGRPIQASRFSRGRMHTNIPYDPTKRYFTLYRNRGYLCTQARSNVTQFWSRMAAVRLVLSWCPSEPRKVCCELLGCGRLGPTGRIFGRQWRCC